MAKSTNTKLNKIIECLQMEIPKLEGIYLFGSRASGDERSDSDWDLGYLSRQRLTGLELWILKVKLSELVQSDVDLVDLYSADVVTRKEVVQKGRQVLVINEQCVAQFEYLTLSFYQKLNEERAGILKDIRTRGSIYG